MKTRNTMPPTLSSFQRATASKLKTDFTDEAKSPGPYSRHATQINSEDSGGTGASRSNEVWHELRPHSSRQVSKYPADGYNDPFWGGTVNGKAYSLGREWQATKQSWDEKELSQVVELTVRYWNYQNDAESQLFERHQKAVFQWDPSSRTFKLAKSSNPRAAELLRQAR